MFYYVVALLNKIDGYVGTEGVFIGDRIAPQTTELKDKNIIIVNYADRKIGEDFTVAPSVGKSIWLKLDPKTILLGEVAQNFEGEADPARMTLGMKKWDWVKTLYSDDKLVTPLKQNKFSITFNKDNTFSATTDCNSMGGSYKVKDKNISFDKIFSTKMYCENSQESVFVKMLEQTQGYLFTSKGEMVFTLKYDSGSVYFR